MNILDVSAIIDNFLLDKKYFLSITQIKFKYLI